MTHVIGLVLVAVGCGVAAASAFGLVLVRGIFLRLHFLTPVTTVAAPLVAVGLAVESGQPWTIAELLVVAVLLVVTGPVLETATARVAAQQQGRIDPESPQ